MAQPPGSETTGPPLAREHGTQHEDRGAHLAHDVVIGRVAVEPMGRQRQHPPVIERRHLRPQRLQQARHGADVRQARRVGQRQRLVRQKRRGHQREAGVLGACDGDLPLQRTVARYDDLVHWSALALARPRRVMASYAPCPGSLPPVTARLRACALRLAMLALSADFSRTSRSDFAPGFVARGVVAISDFLPWSPSYSATSAASRMRLRHSGIGSNPPPHDGRPQ
jgi:hypothetical protein